MKNTQHKNNRDLWFENEDGKLKGFWTVGVDVGAKQANREIGLYEDEGTSSNNLKRNEKKASPDPVWHHEYWARYIRIERHFLQVIEYIHMNPVKAGLVLRPGDWLWSIASGQSGDWRARGGAE